MTPSESDSLMVRGAKPCRTVITTLQNRHNGGGAQASPPGPLVTRKRCRVFGGLLKSSSKAACRRRCRDF